LMIDLSRKCICYYDSTGDRPPVDVINFMKHVQASAADTLKVKLPIKVNRVERQFQNNECGVFSLTFLALMLETSLTFKEIVNVMGSDREMQLLRYVFYTPS